VVVFGKLNYDLENRPEIQALRRRSTRVLSCNLFRRQSRSYRLVRSLRLRMRVPWNDFSGKNESLNDDFEGIEVHYKIPRQNLFENPPDGEVIWKCLLEFDICAINGKPSSNF
jgi:hypothetical protein